VLHVEEPNANRGSQQHHRRPSEEQRLPASQQPDARQDATDGDVGGEAAHPSAVAQRAPHRQAVADEKLPDGADAEKHYRV
jgi:hypothetical protein